MDENDFEIDSKASSSLFSRFRSPAFQQNEVKALLQLVEKNKYVLLNKLTNSVTNTAKEKAWAKVAIEFNKQGLGPNRTGDVLKTKWENLKRNARRLAKDVMDDDCDFGKDEMKKTIMMICTAENIEFDERNNSFEDHGADFKPWGSDEEDNATSFALGGDVQKETSITCDARAGFTPRDCRVLLKCVRQEKRVLFSNTSLLKRQQAWKRIAETYNSQSPRKKTAKDLNKKFNTMKSVARKVNVRGFFKNRKRIKYEQLDDNRVPLMKKIKTEPMIECTADEYDLDSDDGQVLNNPVDNVTHTRHFSLTRDPLNNAHSSDSGLGSITDTKDAARLKVELLNYKMETARLERKRIEDAIKGDETEREMRLAERALRLRAARLAAAAAEAELPPSHPALQYTPQEKLAHHHLSDAQLDVG